MRKRDPGIITGELSRNFGLEVSVQRSPRPKVNESPSGIPDSAGGLASSKEQEVQMAPGNRLFRDPIPPGSIGTMETYDPQLPPPQYVDTVADYPTAQNDPKLHGAVAALRSADKTIPVRTYGEALQPRRAPLPRARQDEGFLGPPATMSADQLMTDDDSSKLILERDVKRKDLYGDNRAGVLHNDPAMMKKCK